MSRRSTIRLALLSVGALSATALAPTGAGAAPSPTAAYERLQFAAKSTFVPAAAQGDKQVKVIVQLAQSPVGDRTATALAAGTTLTEAQKRALRAQVATGQKPVTDLVESRGGDVLETYQDAYNGVTVSVKQRDLAAIAAAPNVLAIHKVRVFKPDTVPGVQYIGGNQAWQKGGSTGLTGDGVKIAVIDTGVDYTHADFGGAGTPEAFKANNPAIVEPGTFPTAKVAGGYDFVGDDYAADSTDPAKRIPHPDNDPLDCNGHGTHVAGIAAGQGVASNGSPYAGPYDSTTYSNTFSVGPGVAPKAKIYAYKVFGCEGSVENSIVIDALNRALLDGINVVNMSLGSSFGSPGDPEVATVNTLSLAGVTVVASAGNSGPSAYITGAPAAADRAISVAALDASRATVPGAHAVFSTGGVVDLQDSNEAAIPAGPLPVKVLRNADGTLSLGCNPAEYVGVTGALVITKRGVCARAARAIFGQQAGAAAVVMINSNAAFPPMEGPITSNPDTGAPYVVTIPFLGAPGTAAVVTALLAADGGTVTLTATQLPNIGYQNLASFTSGGPRNGDSIVKPDVTAPGIAVQSAGIGTGVKPATISGTSQASPFTAGTAALVVQAHPTWSPERIKAAIVNTADPALDKDYSVRLAGSGVVQAQRAVDTKGLILAGKGQSTLSFGAKQIRRAYGETIPMKIANTGADPITYTLAGAFVGPARGAAITATPSTVTVPPNGTAVVNVTLSLNEAAVAALPPADASNFGRLVSIAGAVVATPTSSGPGIYSLRVPFLLAPRGLSKVTASGSEDATQQPTGRSSSVVELENEGVHVGNADFYAWNISDPKDTQTSYVDVRAAGVQSLPGTALGGAAADRSLIFAVNMYKPWSNAATTEVDIPIDRTGDGVPDAWVIAVDFGVLTSGNADGRFAVATLDAAFNIIDVWAATAPMNTSTMELPALASELGLTAATGPFNYSVASLAQLNGDGDTTETGTFDAYAPAVSTGASVDVAPGTATSTAVDFDPTAAAAQHTKGWLVVTLDDAAGAAQADLVPLPAVSHD